MDYREAFRVPPLYSGGVILSYRCNSRCRHCLYACGPERENRWMTESQLADVFDCLAREESLSGVHLAGGEPFLDPDLLETALRMAGESGVPVDYVETNGVWASNETRARQMLLRMRDAGLSALLVSVSPFHLEYVPLENTVRCIEAARDVFHGRVIVWQEHWLRIFRSIQATGRMSFEALLSHFPQEDRKRIPDMYSLTPGGRVPFALKDLYTLRPASAYAGTNCRRRLTGTTHFHIDNDLNLIPDLCSGIAAARISNLHDDQDFSELPVISRLYNETMGDLLEWASDEYGFIPSEVGYASTCHLCADVRRHLAGHNAAPELRPLEFYAEVEG